MQQIYSCPKCGYQVAFGARFCGHCGIQLDFYRQVGTFQPSLYNPKDRLYLAVIAVENDPNAKPNILFCDALGHLSNSHLDEFIVDTSKQILSYYRGQKKYCAVACFEISQGVSRTFGVEIAYEEGVALEGITTAFRNREISDLIIPKHFQKYISQIYAKAYAELKYQQRFSSQQSLPQNYQAQ